MILLSRGHDGRMEKLKGGQWSDEGGCCWRVKEERREDGSRAGSGEKTCFANGARPKAGRRGGGRRESIETPEVPSYLQAG
jgi:hypothetical protein